MLLICFLFSGCSELLGITPKERQVVVWRAVPLKEIPAYLEYGKTTSDEVLDMLGSPEDILEGPEVKKLQNRPDVLWYYYPSKRELVYTIAFVDSKGEIHNYRFAPSNNINPVIWFKKDKVIMITML
jgi:hypothetical protein